MVKRTTFTIGKLAREAEVNVETIRYYQRRGLLDQPVKPMSGGFRRYTEKDVGRVRFIKRAQQLGFTLAEIGELIPHVDAADCRAASMLARKKLKAIETQLNALEEIRSTLKSLICDCAQDCQPLCPMLIGLHGLSQKGPGSGGS